MTEQGLPPAQDDAGAKAGAPPESPSEPLAPAARHESSGPVSKHEPSPLRVGDAARHESSERSPRRVLGRVLLVQLLALALLWALQAAYHR